MDSSSLIPALSRPRCQPQTTNLTEPRVWQPHMERRRTLTLAAVTALLAAAVVVSYVALVGFESSLLSEQLVYIQQTVTTGSASPIALVRTNKKTPIDMAAAADSVVTSDASMVVVIHEQEQPVNVTSGDNKIPPQSTPSLSPQDDNTAEKELEKVLADHDASESSPAPVTSKTTAQDTSLGSAAEQIATIAAPVQHSKQPEQTKTPPPHLDELDELMTPELIAKIENERIDPLSPIQVHLVWIGDINKAPGDRFRYTEQGYDVTVHTSAEEILDGFHPFVLKAYNLAIPKVVGYDFLKFALLYKHGGFVADADTSPAVNASEIKFPSDCDVMFGKEAVAPDWEKPVYRDQGGPTYGLTRPFQILNWAMVAAKPRNKHIKWFLLTAMMHFFGLRDMEYNVVQDISGSGIMTDYVALLHEKAGRSYRDVYLDKTKYVPVEGLCLTDEYLRGKWIQHAFIGTWKNTEEPLN